MEQLYTSTTLWQDFDPTSEDLDVNILKTTEQNGIVTKQVYFTGRSFADGGKTRVFATICNLKDKASKKAVLVVGNYKLPIDVNVLQDLAKRGFVAMAIDFAGRRETGLHTLYPGNVSYCNAEEALDLFEITQTAKETKLYEYALNARRAVTYLFKEDKVTKVSLITVGKGAYVGLIALGSDKRFTNGVVLFGSLRELAMSSGAKVDLSDSDDLSVHLEQNEKKQKWAFALAPQAYASQITVPLYVINSANSAAVDISEVDKMFYRINDDSRLLIVPQSIDFLPSEYCDSVINWIKGSKIPAEAELTSFYDSNGDYNVKIKKDKKTSQISVWYCTNASSGCAKYWVKANVEQDDNYCVAKINLYEKQCDVISFAVLDGNIAISTPFLSESVTVKNIKVPNNIIFSGSGSQNLLSLNADKDCWWNTKSQGDFVKGYLDIVGMQGKILATFALNDKSIRRNPSLTFSFDVCCSVKQTLYVSSVCNFGSTNDAYTQSVELTGDGKWQRVTIEGEKFRRVEDGKSLAEKEKIDLLVIHADNEFIVNNLCLI